MDCGPASLKAFLAAFGIDVSYDRLREACQTDIDGSSIDTLEEVAAQLGVEAKQIMLPVDHLLLPGALALPAIVVVRLPGGLAHFLVAAHTRGSRVQVMDPASGLGRSERRAFLDRVYVHRHRVSADAWRAWAGEEEFLSGLERRMAALRIGSGRRSILLARALGDRGWYSVAALDAAVRLAGTIACSRARIPTREATALTESLLNEALRKGPSAIPARFWFAWVPDEAGPDAEEVILQGAVLLRGKGVRWDPAHVGCSRTGPVSSDRLAELSEPEVQSARRLWRFLRADGLLSPVAFVSALALGSGAVMLEAALFRGILEIGDLVTLPLERLSVLGGVVVLLALLLSLDVPILAMALQMGRKLELRLRVALDEKIPRLEDRYFASRLVSDFAERSHAAHRIRDIPAVVQLLLRATFQFLSTVAGIVWLDPWLTPLALGAAIVVGGLPLAFRPQLEHRDLRLRTHSGALSRYYFDALLGLWAIRSHGAERPLRVEHEGVLREWYRSASSLLRWSVMAEAGQMALGFLVAVALVARHLSKAGGSPEVLLLIYWALLLPSLGQRVGFAARQLSSLRSIAIRLLEPLSGPETTGSEETAVPQVVGTSCLGVALRTRGLSVRLGGQPVLRDLDLDIPSGAHVAVVGRSGAGKSTLMGLLLGWHRPNRGEAQLDGCPLTPRAIDRLRSETAWIDPEVQLWNRSLLENLLYGHDERGLSELQDVVRDAELLTAIDRLDEGLKSRLGEGGGLLSGGEGQRVRFGRALYRRDARLVILDEAFRGLDRGTRRVLVERARNRWHHATLLCVTHDVELTREFPRVLVLEEGRLVEDGSPDALLSRERSHYRALLEAEETARQELWAAHHWRKLRMEEGRLRPGRRRDA